MEGQSAKQSSKHIYKSTLHSIRNESVVAKHSQKVTLTL